MLNKIKKEFMSFATSMNNNIKTDIQGAVNAGTQIVKNAVNTGAQAAQKAVNAGNEIVQNAAAGAQKYASSTPLGKVSAFGSIAEGAIGTISSFAEGVQDNVVNPVNGALQNVIDYTSGTPTTTPATSTAVPESSPATEPTATVMPEATQMPPEAETPEGTPTGDLTMGAEATGTPGMTPTTTIGTVTANQGEIESGELIDPVAEEIQNEVDATIDTGKLTFDEWKATYGADTETDFQNAKAQLEYEMATWAANYGANAEKLYQMGLSNSGVSDIFGANAYAAYVGAMNQLYLEKIRLDRENIDLYEQYSNKYEADLASKTKERNNNITNAYLYGLGIYDGSNFEAVKTMMLNAGYDADVVEEAAARLAAVDPSMIPSLKEKELTSKANRAKAFNENIAKYTPENAAAIRAGLIANNMSEADADIVMDDLKKYYDALPESIKNAESLTMISEIVSTYSAQYDPSRDGQIKAVLEASNISSDIIDEALKRLKSIYDNTPEAERPDVVAQAAKDKEFKENVAAGYSSVLQNGLYDGTNEDSVKQQLLNQNYTEEAATEIINRLKKLDKNLFTNAEVMKAYTALNEILPQFTGSDVQKGYFEDMMKRRGVTDETVLNGAWELALAGLAVENEMAANADEATRKQARASAFAANLGYYTPNKAAAIKAMLTGNGMIEEDADIVIGDLQKYYDALPDSIKNEESMANIARGFNAYVGSYDPAYKDSIKTSLKANGYSDDEITAILGNLDAYYNGLPDSVKNAESQANIARGFNAYVGSYDPAYKDSIKTSLKANGYSDDEITAILGNLDAYYNGLPESVKNAESQATIKSVYNMAKATYYPGMWNNIATDLKNQGLTDDEIRTIKSQLDAYYNTLEENKRPDVLAKADADASFEAKVINGYSSVLSSGNYNGSNGESIKTQLTNLGYTEKEAAEIVARLDKLDKSLFKNSDIMKAYNLLLDSIHAFTGSAEQRTYFEQLLAPNGITDEDVISKAWGLALSGMKANGAEANGAESTTSDTITAGARAVVDALFTDIPYESKGVQKEQIRQALKGTEFESQTEQIIAQMDEEYNALKEASAADIVTELDELEVGSSAISEYSALLSQARSAYGKDSKEYKQVLAKASEKVVSTFKWALEAKPDGTAERLLDTSVLDQLNIDSAELEGLSKSEQAAYVEQEIMDKAAELHKSGMISSEEYIAFVKDDWLKSELENIIAEDSKAGNLKAIGLRDAGAVVADIMSWKDNGAISEDEYQELLGYVVDTMKFKLNNKGQISWYDTVKGAEATVGYDMKMFGTEHASDEINNELQKIAEAQDKNGTSVFVADPYSLTGAKYRVVSHNGKLYYAQNLEAKDKWYVMSDRGIVVAGDRVTNSKAQKAGIYEILVYLLTPAKGEVGSSGMSQVGSNIGTDYMTRD